MTITLSTGKEVSCNNGIIGVTEDLEELTEGYDSPLEMAYQRDPELNYGDPAPFTPAERVEIADLMIARWQAFRARWASC